MTGKNSKTPAALVEFHDPNFEEIAKRRGRVVYDPKTGEQVPPGSNLGVVLEVQDASDD